jgi:hypothetical protein
LQIRALREYAAQRGWTIALQVKEVGSGASQRQLREMLLEAARRRKIDVVLVWRLDRWGRSVADLLATLQELDHLGVGFVSLTEALDLTTPAGRAMAALLAVFPSSSGRFCESGSAPVWPTPGKTASAWVDRQQQHGIPLRPGNSIALASAKPRSPGDWTSAEPRCAGLWKQIDEKTGQRQDQRRPYPQRSHRGRLRIGRESDELVLLPFGKGKQYLNHSGPIEWVLGGWQVSTILVFQSRRSVQCHDGWNQQ